MIFIITMANSKSKQNNKKYCIILCFLLLTLCVHAQKTWVLAGNGNWSVGANWSGGTVPTSTDDVTLTAGAARVITIDGNFSVNNISTGSNITLSIGGTNTLTVNGNFSQSAGIFNGGTGTLNIRGNFSKTAGTFNQPNQISFTGSSAQTFSSNDATRNLNNVLLNNSAGLSIIAPATNLVIANDLQISNGSLSVGSNTLTLNGTVSSFSSSNTLTGSSTSNLTIGGTGTLGTLFFNSTTPGTTNQFNTIVCNRTTSGSVVIGNDMHVLTTLTLTNGLINTGVNKVVIKSTGSVSRTNGYIQGNLQKNVATGATSRTFEIGDATNYLPVNINFANVTSAGDLLVSTASPLSTQPNIGSVFLNTSSAINRYWTVSNVNTLAFTTYNATFNFVSGDIIGSANTATLRAGIYASSWTYPAMGTLNTTNSTISSVNTLGTVILASCAAPTAFTVTGGGGYCSGSTGAVVGLSGSEAGVNYQLQIGGVNTGSPVSGTGGAFSFGAQTTAGNYTVVATRTATGCTGSMSNSINVTINPLPGITVAGNPTICSGTSTFNYTYTNVTNGANQYAVVWGTAAINAGFTNTGNLPLSGGILTIPNIPANAGTYPFDIIITNSSTGCTTNISTGSVCGTANENQSITLSSPNGLPFTNTIFASYGLPNGTCGNFTVGSCHATTSTNVIDGLAVGNTSFTVNANNTTFGDPCNGTVKRLYIEVGYKSSLVILNAVQASISGPTSVCNGNSITLSAPSGATSYSWSTGATTQSITVSPTSNTTYSVTVTTATCSSSASQTVTVNGNPSVTLGNNSPAVCSGINSTSIAYTAPVNGANQYSITWTSAALSAGFVNVSNATLLGGNIPINNIPSAAGNYPATITISNSNTGCATTITAATMCGTANENNAITLTAPAGNNFIGINFASYGLPNGTCGNFSIGTCHATTSLSVVQTAALNRNTFTVNANNATFGDPCVGTGKRLYIEAVYGNFSLQVKALPTNPVLGSNTPVCSGNTINLTCVAQTGATYAWSGPNSFTSTTQNPSITNATTGMSGTYTATLTIAGCINSNTISVTVNQAPSATIAYGGTPFCASVTNGAVTLTGTTGGAFSAPAALSINTTSGAINASASTVGGPYTVTYTIAAAGGCSIFTTTTAVSVLSIPTAVTVTGGGTTCTGLTLTASGGTGGTMYYQGTISNGTSTAIAATSQSVSASGTYYFRARTASGCWSSQGSAIVTNLTPLLSGVSVSALSCTGVGATVQLTGMLPNSSNNTINYTINSVAQTAVTGVSSDASGNASFTSAVVTTANNGQMLRITSIANVSCSATFTTSTTLTINATSTWLGVNNNWNDAQNWCGGVPSNNANITLPAGRAQYPVISSGTTQMNNLTIASGASFTFSGTGILRLTGSITNSGTLNLTDGTLDLAGTSAQSFAGSMLSSNSLKNLRISNSNGVSLLNTNDTLKLTGSIDFGTSNATINTNGNLTLISNTSGTARVGDLTGGGTFSGNDINGNVTVERFIPNHPKAWQLLAVPTNGQNFRQSWIENNTPVGNNRPGYGTIVTGNVPNAVALGFDFYTPSGSSIKSYNSTNDSWISVSDPNSSMATAKGYMVFVRGDRSVTTSSAPATATNLRTTGALYTTGAKAPAAVTVPSGKFEIVGNPYASMIDFRNVTKSAAPNVDNLFYVWDPLLTNYSFGYGGYQTISAVNGWRPVPGGTANYDANVAYPYIQSGQAFMVHSTSGAGSVSFTEACKTTGSKNTFREQEAALSSLRIQLINQANNLADGLLFVFDTAYSKEYDHHDALKILNTSENIGILNSEKVLAIDARNIPADADTALLQMKNMKLQSYTFRIYPSAINHPGLTAFLHDRFTNRVQPINLNDSSEYSFNVSATAGANAIDRFFIEFKLAALLPVNIVSVNATRIPNKKVKVSWRVENEINISHYVVEQSTDGRNFAGIQTVQTVAINNHTYTVTDDQATEGDNFYRIKALSLDGSIQLSEIVKVAAITNTSGISIYTIEKNTIRLQFKDCTKGKYSVVLIGSNGAQQKMSDVNIADGNEAVNLELPVTAAGNYYIKILKPDHTTITKQLTLIP